MTQLPYGAPDEGEESQRGYTPQQHNQYPPYGQEHGQYQSPPPAGYGPPQGGNQQYYGQGQDNWNRGPGEYQQPHSQQQYPGPHAYGQNYNSSYGSPPPGAPYGTSPPLSAAGAPYGSPHPPASPYGAPPPAPRYGNYENQDRFGGSGERYASPEGPPPGHQGYAPPDGPPPGHQGYAPPPGPPPQHPGEADRGLLGALAGGAAGGYAGHQVHHGFIGALGGAYGGHKLEDHIKAEKKRKKEEKKAQAAAMGVPYRRGSSSSSSSSDDERKKLKKKQQPPQQQQFRGNFSASSAQISLDKDYDLIASCSSVSGQRKLSSISLNDVLTNENGYFKWVLHGGNFGGSARNVRLENGGKVLVAELGTMDGRWREDHIWLDERIGNNDGDLRYV